MLYYKMLKSFFLLFEVQGRPGFIQYQLEGDGNAER